MNRDLDKNERIEDVLRSEEDAIQKDMEELSRAAANSPSATEIIPCFIESLLRASLVNV